MDFSQALAEVKAGRKITREGWNGAGMYVVYQPGYPDGIAINENTARATGIPQGTVCRFRPYLMLRAVDGSFVPWVPSISDVLADDWGIDITAEPKVVHIGPGCACGVNEAGRRYTDPLCGEG